MPKAFPFDVVEAACRVGDHWHVYLNRYLERMTWKKTDHDELRSIRLMFRATR
jgi:hypothetical protein